MTCRKFLQALPALYRLKVINPCSKTKLFFFKKTIWVKKMFGKACFSFLRKFLKAIWEKRHAVLAVCLKNFKKNGRLVQKVRTTGF